MVSMNRIKIAKKKKKKKKLHFLSILFFHIIDCKIFRNITLTQCIIFCFTVFCFELLYFCSIDNNKLLLPLYCRLNTNLLFGCVKSIGYIASAINVESSNPCTGPSPSIKISLFLLSIWTDELISAPEMMTFSPPYFHL